MFNSSNPNRLIFESKNITYTVLGGINNQLDSLRVTLSVSYNELIYRTKLDLYEDRQTERISKIISEKLDIPLNQLLFDLSNLTNELEKYRESIQVIEEPEVQSYILTSNEKRQALLFLKKPDLVTRLNELLGKIIVGENSNRIMLFISALSHKTSHPLNSLVFGSSGSGKSMLVHQISDCMPEESVLSLTRISDKALFNVKSDFFTNKLIVIEDMDGLSFDSLYSLREIQSNGKLTSQISTRNQSGQLVSATKTIFGPVATIACSTKKVYVDNSNRSLHLNMDESIEQTMKVLDYQRNKALGKINPIEEKQTKLFIQNLVRSLKNYEVINPYADRIQLPIYSQNIRRLNVIFLDFIKMVTLLNQYQRQINDKQQLITEIEDIKIAIELLLSTIILKIDDLEGTLRCFYERLKKHVESTSSEDNKNEFSLREIRTQLKISKTQLFRFIKELSELEYIRKSGGYVNKGYIYQITHWDNHTDLIEKIKSDLYKQLALL